MPDDERVVDVDDEDEERERMIPVDQQFAIGDGSGRLGDCLRACVASLYELSSHDVPHFVERQDWWRALSLWAKDQGHSTGLDEPPFPVVSAFGLVIALGASPRDPEVRHAVVVDAITGALAHDPHPSRAGLVGDPVEVITFVDRTEDERRDPDGEVR